MLKGFRKNLFLFFILFFLNRHFDGAKNGAQIKFYPQMWLSIQAEQMVVNVATKANWRPEKSWSREQAEQSHQM